MSRERGQALVEAMVAIPVCMACALTLVECGVLVRDRIVVSQAATRAAEAQMAGRDPADAARTALPKSMRDALEVNVRSDRVAVSVRSDSRAVQLIGARVIHRSSVAIDAVGGAS